MCTFIRKNCDSCNGLLANGDNFYSFSRQTTKTYLFAVDPHDKSAIVPKLVVPIKLLVLDKLAVSRDDLVVCKVVVFVVFVVFVLFRGQTRGREGQEKHKGHEIHGGCENVISFFKVDSQIFPLVRDKLSHLVVSTRKILLTPALTFSSCLADVVFFQFRDNRKRSDDGRLSRLSRPATF